MLRKLSNEDTESSSFQTLTQITQTQTLRSISLAFLEFSNLKIGPFINQDKCFILFILCKFSTLDDSNGVKSKLPSIQRWLYFKICMFFSLSLWSDEYLSFSMKVYEIGDSLKMLRWDCSSWPGWSPYFSDYLFVHHLPWVFFKFHPTQVLVSLGHSRIR